MAKPRARVDWDALKPHYSAGVRPLREIGEQFGCSDAAIIKHAKANGWERNLKQKIQDRADKKVAAALVAQERGASPAAKLTEEVRVEVEAEVQARVRQSHRTDINRSKSVANALMQKLEHDTTASKPKHTLKEWAGIFKQLVDGQRTLVSMEREAYGIAHLQEDADDSAAAIDPVAGAKAIAFILARAGAQLSKGKS
jgi:hypothetical protein